jgi:hypothetical protein
MALEPEDDYMRDELIDNGLGFSVEELEAYQHSK